METRHSVCDGCCFDKVFLAPMSEPIVWGKVKETAHLWCVKLDSNVNGELPVSAREVARPSSSVANEVRHRLICGYSSDILAIFQ